MNRVSRISRIFKKGNSLTGRQERVSGLNPALEKVEGEAALKRCSTLLLPGRPEPNAISSSV